VFAVLAEELGFVGAAFTIALFAVLVWRALCLGRRAAHVGCDFQAFLATGIGIWLGMQAVINIGVNMGLLPTKGLTLPLLSYGGSSLLVTCACIGVLLRIDYEVSQFSRPVTRKTRRRRS
jgi:cell division protein FtsW